MFVKYKNLKNKNIILKNKYKEIKLRNIYLNQIHPLLFCVHDFFELFHIYIIIINSVKNYLGFSSH